MSNIFQPTKTYSLIMGGLLIAIALVLSFVTLPGLAADLTAKPDFGGENPADVIHPNIHDKVGDGSNANPNEVSPTGGAEIHGIANVGNGVADLGNVHGGIQVVNKNVDQ